MPFSTILSELIYTVPAVLIALVLHEWSHAFISYKLGDPSPKQEGRLSLNPLKHLDPMGALCLLLFHFGWAKPVSVNPYYYKDKKMGMSLTALAGPVMNFILSFVALFLLGLMVKFIPELIYTNSFVNYIYEVIYYTALLSIGLGIFNLIPIPPLDGSKVLFAILPEATYFKLMQYERYGFIVLILFLYLGFDAILNPIMANIFNGMLNVIITLLGI